MKILLYFNIVLLLLFSTGCKDECQDIVNRLSEAKYAYDRVQSETNCLTYKALINEYLNSSCGARPPVDYDRILEFYKQELDCDIFIPSPPGISCMDGIRNGSETGIDCGGPDCPSCDNPDSFFSSFYVNGELTYNQSTVTIGESMCCVNNIATTTAVSNYLRYFNINFPGKSEIQISDLQALIANEISWDETTGGDFLSIELDYNGALFSTVGADNTSSSGFTINSVDLYSSNTLGTQTQEIYRVEATYYGTLVSDLGAELPIENGALRLLFQNVNP